MESLAAELDIPDEGDVRLIAEYYKMNLEDFHI